MYNKIMKTMKKMKKMSRKNRSFKNQKTNKNGYSHQKMVIMFLQMLNTIKLYHWKTTSFAEHKATDDLYSKMNASIDTFVEIMLGKGRGSRVNLTATKHIPLSDFSSSTELKREVEMYKNYLIRMPLQDTDTDLLNTRDEMLGNLNQFTYLLTFH